MNPVQFPEVNKVFAKDQPEYNPLPVFMDLDKKEIPVVSCWKMSFKERITFMFTGKVYLNQITFGRALQPVYLTTIKSEVIQITEK